MPVSKAGFGPGTSALQLAAGQGHVPVVRWGVDKTCPWSFVALARPGPGFAMLIGTRF